MNADPLIADKKARAYMKRLHAALKTWYDCYVIPPGLKPVETLSDYKHRLGIADDHWTAFLNAFMLSGMRLKRRGPNTLGEATATIGGAPVAPVIDPRIAALEKQVEEERAKKMSGPIELTVKLAGKKPVKVKRAHVMLPQLIRRVGANVNTFLVGPAGSGKTTAAAQAADALDLEFGFMSVGPQTTKTDIFGYMSASGSYVATEFRKRYEKGGIFLFDEMDAGNAGVFTSINGAIAGNTAPFPDKMVARHPEFRCLGAGNTYGLGASRVYVGRQELDGASLDRFNFLEWGYDEGLEMAIATAIDADHAKEWVPYVQRVRKAVESLGIRLVVSPRASIEGTKLLVAGVSRSDVETTQLFKSLKPDDVTRITANL